MSVLFFVPKLERDAHVFIYLCILKRYVTGSEPCWDKSNSVIAKMKQYTR